MRHILDRLKTLFTQFRMFLDKNADVHYTSVPVWKPWRDF
jgi:hypothetical protein